MDAYFRLFVDMIGDVRQAFIDCPLLLRVQLWAGFGQSGYFSNGIIVADQCRKRSKLCKGGRRYYYYLCSKDSKRAISECPVKQIPSGDIEALVRKQLQKMLSDISLVMRFAEQSGMSPVEVVECFREEFWNEISPGEYNRLLILLVEKAIVWEDRLELELKTCGVKSLLEEFKNE